MSKSSKKKSPVRIAISGLFCVGKDYVAEKAGLKTISIAEPLYRACEYFFGSCNKKREDHRKFLQDLGQLGWGCPTSVCNIANANMIWLMRNYGGKITGYRHIEWTDFGKRKDFWINIALYTVNYHVDYRDAPVAITNARYEHEIEPLKKTGFEHYLVRCSYEMRSARNGGAISTLVDQDVSEQYARKLEEIMPPSHTIWNDPAEAPLKGCLSVDRFVEKIRNAV